MAKNTYIKHCLLVKLSRRTVTPLKFRAVSSFVTLFFWNRLIQYNYPV